MPRPVLAPKSTRTSFASPRRASSNGSWPKNTFSPSSFSAVQARRPFAPSTSAVTRKVVERSVSSSVKTLPGCAWRCSNEYSACRSVTPKRLNALREAGSGFMELSSCWKFSHGLPVTSKSR